MAKGRESFSKNDREERERKKRLEKERRKEERKSAKGSSSFEDMIAYVDENGNITNTPPDPTKKKVIKEEDIEVSVRKQEPGKPEDLIRKGKVTFFNTSKGYGFIKDLTTQESIFVHIKSMLDPINEGDKVTFEVEMGPKGPNAVRVKKG